MNQIVLIGRLTRNPEIRHTPQGTAVTSFAIAVDRPYVKDREKQTDFIDCVAWRGTAEFIAKYFAKGQQIALTGRLQMRQWTDKEGNKRISAEVIAEQAYFCEKKSEAYTPAAQQEFAELDDDPGDLPF